MRSSLRSPSQLEGTQSILPQLEKDLKYWGPAPAGSRGTLRRDSVGERETERERMNVADKNVEERKRLIFLGLHRKPIKTPHRTCSVHGGHRLPLDGVRAQSTFSKGS